MGNIKKNFYEAMEKAVAEHFEGKGTVTRQEVMKRNGVMMEGLLYRPNGSNVAPTVYLDGFYNELMNGKSFDSLVKELCELIEKYKVEGREDLSYLLEWEEVRSKICFKLISAELNEEKLRNMPHRMICDMAMVYYIDLRFNGIDGTVQITDAFVEKWETTEDQLYEAAMDNTPRMHKAQVMDLSNFLHDRGMPEEITGQVLPMVVVNNEEMINVAGVIMYRNFLEDMFKKIGGNFYLIPASVHEMILVPKFEGMGTDYLNYMVREVNRSCLDAQDVLSDKVYEFDGEKLQEAV